MAVVCLDDFYHTVNNPFPQTAVHYTRVLLYILVARLQRPGEQEDIDRPRRTRGAGPVQYSGRSGRGLFRSGQSPAEPHLRQRQ